MIEKLMEKKSLNINCDIACVINDQEGLFERYDSVNLNCDTYIASPSVNATLLEKHANINAENIVVTSHTGEFVQISGGILQGSADYKGMYVIISGDVVLRTNNVGAFKDAVEAAVTGTLYYPESAAEGLFSRVRGNKRAYPEDAHIILGSHSLERVLGEVPADKNLVWVAGEVTVLDKAYLQKAEERGLHIICDRVFAYESMQEALDKIIETPERVFAPDGYTVTGPLTLNAATAIIYDTRIFVRGALRLEEKDAECLNDFEAIIVKGCAKLPISCAKAFKKVGRADSYKLFDGQFYQVNGFEMISHERLHTMAERGEKISMQVNGFIIFAEDVTAADMDAISGLSCNGMVIMPGEAQGALAQRLGSVNGSVMDIDMIKQITGLTFPELVMKFSGEEKTGGNVNTDIYMLV